MHTYHAWAGLSPKSKTQQWTSFCLEAKLVTAAESKSTLFFEILDSVEKMEKLKCKLHSTEVHTQCDI